MVCSWIITDPLLIRKGDLQCFPFIPFYTDIVQIINIKIYTSKYASLKTHVLYIINRIEAEILYHILMH